jgi:PAS domain S-box-containing protein
VPFAAVSITAMAVASCRELRMPFSPALSAALTAALSAPDPRDGLRAALDAVSNAGIADCDADVRGLVDGVLASLRRRVEEQDQLRSVREQLDMLSHASFEGLFIHANGEILFANARVAELLGRTVEDFTAPDTIRRNVAPEDHDRVMQNMASGYEGSYVITGVRKDGSRFLAELQAKQGALGERPVRVVAVRDVTEREEHASQLRESEARLRGLAESAFDMIALTRDGMILDIGGQPELMLGQTRDELIGRPIFDFVAPSALALTRDVIAEQRTAPFESLLVAKNGELVPVEIVAAHATFQGQPVRLAGLRDLREARRAEAERHRLQARMERGQRLEALGVLAGGVAHDFNNLLVGILGNADLLAMGRLEEDQRPLVEAIQAAGQRASDLTHQLLAYAGRRSAPVTEPVDVGRLLDDLRAALSGSLADNAALRFSIEPGCVVAGDPAALSQVLMNLLTNASDALEGEPGGIDVGVQALKRPDSRWDDALGAPIGPGSWVEVTVRDDGVGMDAATRARIFEPFFTTKPSGHGLGLAGCLGILNAHGGAVLVESTPGKGSTFSLLLPGTDTVTPSEPSPADIAGIEPCKVLIVDDEALVRGQLARFLALRGFLVEEADSGEAALMRLSTATPELVIMDFKMNGMNGLDVARRMREQGHDAPILLMSGYYNADAEGLIEEGIIQAFLAKPYDPEALLRAIARASGPA